MHIANDHLHLVEAICRVADLEGQTAAGGFLAPMNVYDFSSGLGKAVYAGNQSADVDAINVHAAGGVHIANDHLHLVEGVGRVADLEGQAVAGPPRPCWPRPTRCPRAFSSCWAKPDTEYRPNTRCRRQILYPP